MDIPAGIALLATGNEIINGDILNTNGQNIARSLSDHHIPIGLHMTVCDAQQDIENALRYLLQQHQVIITIGGLGPTSDDRTRFAISDAIEIPLEFNVDSWNKIIKRLTDLGYDVPRTNRYQCLFPENATIIENPNGTANACRIDLEKQTIFMLPGPPSECLPLFDSVVLPWLLENSFTETQYRQSWLLMGIGEGDLAAKINKVVEVSSCQVGYRVDYPYLELKLSSPDKEVIEHLKKAVYPHINNFIVSENRKTASRALHDFITNHKQKITINDNATRGHLASKLLTPDCAEYLSFTADNAEFNIEGFEQFWDKKDSKCFSITLSSNDKQEDLLIPNRGNRSLLYATEMLAWKILQLKES